MGALILTSKTCHHMLMTFSRYSGPSLPIPALLIKMSIGPNAASTSETILAGSETTSRIMNKVGTSKFCLTSASSVSRSGAVRARHAIEAPAAANARAVAEDHVSK